MDAEIGVLGSIMLLADCFDDIAPIVKAEDFHDESHQILFRRMQEMYSSGRKFDAVLLADKLKKTGEIVSIGGPAYLGKIMHAVPNAAHARYYAEIVRDKAILRRMIEVCTASLREAYDSRDTSPISVVAKAEQRLRLIAEQGAGASESKPISLSVESVMDALDARARGEKMPGIETGYANLDDLTGGFKPGQLIILAGRPAMGKSAAALGIASRVAESTPGCVLFVSREMSSSELTERALCGFAKVSSYDLTTGAFSADDRTRLVEASGKIANLRLHIDDTSNSGLFTIAANARRLQRKHGLSLLVIDYLQLLEPDNPRDIREQQVAKMTRQLKCLARELNVPILCLAQLNRKADTRGQEGSKPKLSDLRESGAIEQDADLVVFCHRPDYYSTKPQPKQGQSEDALWVVAKQRGGRVGDAKMLWYGAYMTYEDRPDTRWEESRYTGEPRHSEMDEWNKSNGN